MFASRFAPLVKYLNHFLSVFFTVILKNCPFQFSDNV